MDNSGFSVPASRFLRSPAPTTVPDLEFAFLLTCLLLALLARPWRMLRGAAGHALLTPMLASLVLLPWLWAMPSLQSRPLQLQLSGAPLVLLMLGWPLAVPVLLCVGLLAWLISPMPWSQALSDRVWLGLVPATLALLLGAAIRRWIGTFMFVYILGRGFLGTVLCLFAAGALSHLAGHRLPDVADGLSLIAHWLMAWGDGFTTGMLCAIFVAYKPEWLATWSDPLYLKKPG